MKEIFDSKLKAKLSMDESDDVRNITHFHENWKSNKQSPLDVAVDYLHNVTKTFRIPKNTLKNMNQKASFDDPNEQNVEYLLSKQKDFFDSTTIGFYQTYLNLPIWRAGLTVTVKLSHYSYHSYC